MRSTKLSILIFTGLLAACSDASTPTVPQVRAPAGRSSTAELEPLIVIGVPVTGCDPWLDANWCQGSGGGPGECMYSSGDPELASAEGCPLTGGGEPADGGDWGGSTPTSTDPPATAPQGVSQADYDKLNRAEKILCTLSPSQCVAVIYHAHYASEWARSETPELGTAEGDNKRDALRHTMWQARMTKYLGAGTAEMWGNAHETSSTSAAATAMDQHNNAVGRDIGDTWSDLEAGVLSAWANGLLVGHP